MEENGRVLQDIKELRVDVSALKDWKSAHDARIDVWWSNQHKWDQEMENRVRALEKSLWKALGGGAVLLLVGNLVIQYLLR